MYPDIKWTLKWTALFLFSLMMIIVNLMALQTHLFCRFAGKICCSWFCFQNSVNGIILQNICVAISKTNKQHFFPLDPEHRSHKRNGGPNLLRDAFEERNTNKGAINPNNGHNGQLDPNNGHNGCCLAAMLHSYTLGWLSFLHYSWLPLWCLPSLLSTLAAADFMAPDGYSLLINWFDCCWMMMKLEHTHNRWMDMLAIVN